MVTLFGEVLRSTADRILFSVAAKLGDAEDLGIAGNITLPNRQVYGMVQQHKGDAKGYWMIRIPFELANLVAQQTAKHKKKRKS